MYACSADAFALDCAGADRGVFTRPAPNVGQLDILSRDTIIARARTELGNKIKESVKNTEDCLFLLLYRVGIGLCKSVILARQGIDRLFLMA